MCYIDDLEFLSPICLFSCYFSTSSLNLFFTVFYVCSGCCGLNQIDVITFIVIISFRFSAVSYSLYEVLHYHWNLCSTLPKNVKSMLIQFFFLCYSFISASVVTSFHLLCVLYLKTASLLVIGLLPSMVLLSTFEHSPVFVASELMLDGGCYSCMFTQHSYLW